MRHNKKFNHLGRKSAHRKAMLSNMACSLILHKRINTTVAKAKALRIYVEPLITKAKNDTTHSRRVVFSYLQDKYAVSELFREIAGKIADRPGGYTRILKTGNRLGDNAEMCIMELVDYNEAMLAAKEEVSKPKTRRSRRGGGTSKKAEGNPVAEKKEVKEVVDEVKAEKIETAEAKELEAKANDAVEDVKAEDVPEAKTSKPENTDDGTVKE
ncbi:MAG: 50S ribosomal protein L17 [Draconibacterium sp.]|nr:MAG: 50S ribosomal protein L17 [Draconibacterium sp.]